MGTFIPLYDMSGVLKADVEHENAERPANRIETAPVLHGFDVDALRDVAGEKVFARGGSLS